MTVAIQPIPAAPTRHPTVPDAPIYRLTIQQYQAMAEAGILNEDDPVELLEGWLVEKMTKNPPHTTATALLLHRLNRGLPSGWFLTVQDPIATGNSLPEPDMAVIRGAPRDYLERRPEAANIAIVVEVADTSLAQDRGTKKRVYAEASIPIYWIVNLIDRRAEVYTDPTGPAEEPDYRQRRDYGPAEEIPILLDGAEAGRLLVQEFLP
jgi:hypothetical protein